MNNAVESITGRVSGSEGGLYTVILEDGNAIRCKPRGRFRHEKIKVLVGDFVSVYKDDLGNNCIDTIFERKNVLLRPHIANVDNLFIIFSCDNPRPILLGIDKLTTIAEQNKIMPVLVISKAELSKEKVEALKSIYEKTGYRLFITSGETGEGIDALRAFIASLEGKISVFAGASGVGKSTLLNKLFPTLDLSTKSVSEKIGRGRHTTRKSDLFRLDEFFDGHCGYIADTPGFSLLDFENFDFYMLEDLPGNFPEFRLYIGKCRYTKCTHRREEGCAILEKVQKGEIALERHESYKALFDQLKEKRSWDKPSHS